MDEKRTVRVACRQANGVVLRLFDTASANSPEAMIGHGAREVGRITLAGPSSLRAGTNDGSASSPATTEVDAEFWGLWKAQNEGSPLLAQGLVYEVEG